MQQLFSIIRLFLLFINLGAVMLLLISCLAPFVSPYWSWKVAFLGLMFPALAAANLFWICFWLFVKKPFALLSAGALLLSLWNISNHVAFAKRDKNTNSEKKYSLLSFNVKVFDLYNWKQNAASKNSILKLITNTDADVVCLQEFYTDDSEEFDIVTLLKRQYPYFHFHKTLTIDHKLHWGIATFSKYPVVGRESIVFDNSMHNVAIATDIVLETDTVRFFNAHLQSIYFGNEEYEGVFNPGDRNKMKMTLWRIFMKLKDAFIKRSFQVDLLAQHIAANPHKTAVCADFNDSPNSYSYRILSEGLYDSFKSAGRGIGTSFPSIFPFLRIDYILLDKKMNTTSYRTLKNRSSDHYAVHATFEMN